MNEYIKRKENVMVKQGQNAKTISCIKADTKEPVAGRNGHYKRVPVDTILLREMDYKKEQKAAIHFAKYLNVQKAVSTETKYRKVKKISGQETAYQPVKKISGQEIADQSWAMGKTMMLLSGNDKNPAQDNSDTWQSLFEQIKELQKFICNENSRRICQRR